MINNEIHKIIFSFLVNYDEHVTPEALIEAGNVRGLQWLQKNNGTIITPRMVELAIRRDQYFVLRYFWKTSPISFLPMHTDIALQHSRICFFFLEKHIQVQLSLDTIDTLIIRNELDMIRYVFSLPNTPKMNSHSLETACLYSLANIAKYIVLEHGVQPTNASFDYACGFGSLEIAKFFHEIGAQCSTNAMDFASIHGHFEMVKWLHENRSEGCTVSAVNGASANGFFEIVEFLVTVRGEPFSEDALNQTLIRNYLHIAKFLVEKNPGIQCNDFVIQYILRDRRIQSFHFILESGCYFKSDRWLAVAAQYNNTEAIEALLTYYTVSQSCIVEATRRGTFRCWKMLMDAYPIVQDDIILKEAANWGRLDIVRHLAYMDGTEAILESASNGHLEIVKYLVRSPSNVSNEALWLDDAMRMACRHGHDHIAKYLLTHFPQVSISDGLLEDAITNGHLRMAQWLFENFQLRCSDRVIQSAVLNNDIEMVSWLTKCFREFDLSMASIIALNLGYNEMAEIINS